MLYNFIDTNEMPLNTYLPAEAICYNGKWIDEEIPAFRTLYATGRESFFSDVSELALESLDGAVFLRRRLTARTITVGYMITAESPEAFRLAFNWLCKLMSGTQVQIVFADEPDKYYIGTCKSVGTPEAGKLCCKAEMEIYCADPCKYAVEETTVSASNNVLTVEYDGTYPARPTLNALFTGDATQVIFSGDAIVTAGDADAESALFVSGDYVQIDCNEAKIYLNNVSTPSLGDIANQYEDFLLQPGTNVITPAYTGATPVFTLTYREAWL